MKSKNLFLVLIALHILGVYGLTLIPRDPPILEPSISYLAFDGSVDNNTALIQSAKENLHILGRKSNL